MMLSRFTPSFRRYPWLLHFGTSTIFRAVPICSPMLTPASALQNQMLTCLATSLSLSMRDYLGHWADSRSERQRNWFDIGVCVVCIEISWQMRGLYWAGSGMMTVLYISYRWSVHICYHNYKFLSTLVLYLINYSEPFIVTSPPQ